MSVDSRYYDSNVGRFVNVDGQLNTVTILGYNLFAYCENNPVMRIDPNGDFFLSAIVATVGTAAVAAIGAVAATAAVGLIVNVAVDVGELIAESIQQKTNKAEEKEEQKSISEPKDTPQEIDDVADSLPQQGKVTAVPDAPYVDAGNQGKHVIGHKNNNDPNRNTWRKGENGVRQTQEAWKNSKQIRPNVRIGISKDGRKIKIHFGKKGIHGYPIFP